MVIRFEDVNADAWVMPSASPGFATRRLQSLASELSQHEWRG
jgi:hypothetical protein